eukprot:SAG31_NODE_1730_length_7424_cov_28.201911_6_plen_179_part_00
MRTQAEKKKAKKKKSKKHKKKHKSKKRKRGSDSSSSDSDVERPPAAASSGGPVRLSEFVKNADAVDVRYSSVTGQKIMLHRDRTDEDARLEAKRARKLAKLNGGDQDDMNVTWGDNIKRKKITDPTALMLQASLQRINKNSRDSKALNAHMAERQKAAKREEAVQAALVKNKRSVTKC